MTPLSIKTKEAIMALEIEYRAETEDDMNDLADELLKVRVISHMGRIPFKQTHHREIL